MSWGTRRRNTIVLIFVTFVVIVTGVYFFNVFYEPPNCFDGKQNGGEAGIDCGGTCVLLCSHQALDPIIHWTRYFQVAPGLYNVVAYVENPNPAAGIDEVPYQFSVYDENNVLLQTRRGSVALPPKTIVPIIGNSLTVGQLEIERSAFEFTGPFIWTRQAPEDPVIVIEDERLTNLDDEPRMVAMLRNTDVVPIPDVRVVAVVYDRNDNAIAVSSTFFERVPASGVVEAFFTWPNPFAGAVSRFELIPVYERNN